MKKLQSIILIICFLCIGIQVNTDEFIIPQTDELITIINNNVPFFTDEEKSRTNTFELYSDLDELNRCGCAFANLHISLMPTEERGDISKIYPTGWHQNGIKINYKDGTSVKITHSKSAVTKQYVLNTNTKKFIYQVAHQLKQLNQII